jgi:uncharacterized SAM-binding protein YcdF (DUF218 family)
MTIIAIIIAISMYLQPNDLANCAATPSTVASCAPVDAIVAVSGGDTNARTDEAIKLYQNGWAHTLIFSGAAQDKTGPSNAAAMQSRAIAAGIPQSAIYLDEASETTKQNAENTQTIFTAHNIKSIILVTSGYHQRRASLEFTKMTSGVVIENHPVATDQDWSFWWWTSPRGWTLAVTELFKILAFNFGVSA